jgi:hypothetical protein
VDTKSDIRRETPNARWRRWAPAAALGVFASVALIVPAFATRGPDPAAPGTGDPPRSPSSVELTGPASPGGDRAQTLEPRRADCEHTVRYGHVPGHLAPVLEIECSANQANKPTEIDPDGSSRSTQPRIPQPTNSTNNSGVAVGYAPPPGAVAITAAQVSALAANNHAEPCLRRP